jgi:CvfB-like winged helix domain
VIGKGHDRNNNVDLNTENDESPLAKGLILQKEIHYFRQARGNVDVVRGEVLPAYVERVRETRTTTTTSSSTTTTTGAGVVVEYRLDVCLRCFGGQWAGEARALELSDVILQRLRNDSRDNGCLELGDKSTPAEIQHVFPGTSKTTFKTALAKLYKLGRIQKPQAYSISLAQPKGDNQEESKSKKKS